MDADRLIQLVTHALAAPDDDARWLVLADHLTEAGDPLGEIIARSIALPKNDWSAWQAVRKLFPAWEARSAPFGTLRRWTRQGLELDVKSSSALLDHLDAIRKLPIPYYFPSNPGDDGEAYLLDEKLARLAYLSASRVNEGTGSYGPGFEDDWHYFRSLTVYRTGDRRVIFQLTGVEAVWRDMEWRADGLYAKIDWSGTMGKIANV
jgi:uncharacterized protein (TIGR02996 family)